MPMTDAELVPLAEQGNADAFEALYRTYNPLVLNVARRFVGFDRAEDAAAEVWLWLLEGRWRLSPGAASADGRLHRFVKTLARFAALKARYVPKDSQVAAEYDPDTITAQRRRLKPTGDPRDDGPTPEGALLRRELRERLCAALRHLPPQYRRVAHMRYLDDMGGPDIAERIGVLAVTIPGYLAQIRARLRADISDVYRIPEPSGRARGGHRRFPRRAR